MKKLFFSCLLCIVGVLSSWAELGSGTCGTNLTWTLSDDGVLTISGSGNMYSYGWENDNGTYRTSAPWGSYYTDIKSVNAGNDVTSIGSSAFYGCSSLASVALPAVTSIGSYAFYDCSSLASVALPAVTSIGSYAFYDCSNISSLRIGSIEQWCKISFGGSSACPLQYTSKSVELYIGDSETPATNIEIPNTVTELPNYAFRHTSITVLSANSATSIGNMAFDGCKSLTSIEIPSVKEIGNEAFWNCTSLTNVDLSKVQVIGNQTFDGCSNISQAFDLRNLKEIGSLALSGTKIQSVRIASVEQWCSALKNHTGYSPWGNESGHDINLYVGESVFPVESIIIPSTVTTVPSFAFSGFNVERVEMPNVEVIEQKAFYCCYELEYVDVSSVKTIKNDAFANCGSLYNMRIGSVEQWCNVAFTNNNSVPIYHIYSSPDYDTKPRNIYIGSSEEHASEISIPTTVSNIPSCAFFRSSIYLIHFEGTTPPALNNINAFPYAAILCVPEESYSDYLSADVYSTIPLRISVEGLTSAEVELTAKDNTSNLLEKIGEDNAGKIVKLKISGSINSYDMMIIRNKMTSLRYIDLSGATIVHNDYNHYSGYCSNDNEIGGYMFAGLNIMYIVLPENVTEIGDGAFKECSSLINVNVPDNVTRIGSYAFKMCTNLSKITLPSKLQSLGYMAFGGCSGIEEANIPYGVTEIPEYCFYWCSNLKTIKIPSSVTYICPGAFNPGIPGSLSDNGGGTFGDTDKSTGNYDLYIDDIESWINITKYDWSGNYLNMSVKNLYIGNSETPTTEISIPEGITLLPKNCFSGFKSITNFILPSSLKEIGINAFEACNGIERINTKNVVTIDENAFYNCKKLTAITFDDKLLTIGSHAFQLCNLQELELSPFTETIKDYAFSSNANLEEVFIPSGIKTIGDYAFSGCSNLSKVIATTIEPIAINQNSFSTYQTATLYIPTPSYYKYYWNTQWSQFLARKEYDKEFSYKYFYLNGRNGDNMEDFTLDGKTGVIHGTKDEATGIEQAPDADFFEGAGFIVGDSLVQKLGDIHLNVNGDNGASIIAQDSAKIDIKDLYVDIKVKKDRWYFFSFPFDLQYDQAVFTNSHVWYRYDGETRAQNGNGGWKKVASGDVMKSGSGYIFQGAVDGTLTVHVPDVTIDARNSKIKLERYVSENANDASWNLLGNSNTAYYSLDNLNYDAPVTIYDNETGNYEAVRMGDDTYDFYPFQAFFIQKPEDTDSITFAAPNKETKNMVDEQNTAAEAKAMKKTNTLREVINLELGSNDVTADSVAAPSDRTRIVVNPKKSLKYEADCDAAKFIADNMPQIYSLDDDGHIYAINERPVGTGIIDLVVKTPKSGYYTVSAPRLDRNAKLRDLEEGVEVDLAENGYTFSAEAATYANRFQLLLTDDSATSIQAVEGAKGIITIEAGAICVNDADADVKVYSVGGTLIASQKGMGRINVSAGTYVMTVNGNSQKVTIND